jgi:hypothetical protein
MKYVISEHKLDKLIFEVIDGYLKKNRQSFDSFISENDVYQTHMFDTLSKRIEDLKRDVLDEVRTNMRDTDYVDKRLGIISSELREEIYDLLVEVEKLKSK